MGLLAQTYRTQNAQADGQIDQKDHPDIDRPQTDNLTAAFADREQKRQQEQDDGEGAWIDAVE